MKKGEKKIQGWTHLGEHGKGWQKDRDWYNRGGYEKKTIHAPRQSWTVTL